MAVAALGCGSDPTSVAGLCVAVVNVHGSFFTTSDAPSVPADSVADTPYLTVTRNTGCLDQGEPADPLAHGESNFLDVGATLHTVVGHAPENRLVVWSDVVDEWLVLEPMGAALH